MRPWLLIVALVTVLGESVSREESDPRESVSGGFLIWMAILILFVILLLGVLGGSFLLVLPLIALGAFLHPWPLVKGVLIPRGMMRTAYSMSRLAALSWYRDEEGGALVAAAWALVRTKERTAEDFEWLEQRLRNSATGRRSVRGSTILAEGLKALARGDESTARMLLESVEMIDPKRSSRNARALAREWLVMDAVARGEWDRVVHLVSEGKLTAAARFMGAVASRFSEEMEDLPARTLWMRWVMVPSKRTLPLLRRALDARPIRAEERRGGPVRITPDLDVDAHCEALRLHAAVLGRAPHTLDAKDLVGLGKAWEAVWDLSLVGRMETRAEVVGAPSGREAVEQFRGEVQEDLATIARVAEIPLREVAGLEGCAEVVQDELLSEIESVCEVLSRRTEEKRVRPPLEEWRDLLAIKVLYMRAVGIGGAPLRSLAFPVAHKAICNHASWLWNEQLDRAAGNAFFRWLLVEAELVGDMNAITILRGNIACGV